MQRTSMSARRYYRVFRKQQIKLRIFLFEKIYNILEVIFMGEPMKKNKLKKHKHIDHDPQEESSKAVFGGKKARKDDEFTPKTF